VPFRVLDDQVTKAGIQFLPYAHQAILDKQFSSFIVGTVYPLQTLLAFSKE
jgi:hypothetical protein